jgi:hypothetical protein
LRKVNAASYNKKHQFCKLMWAGANIFYQKKRACQNLIYPVICESIGNG